MTSASGEPTKSRILFVDDEQAVLDGLRRMLRGHRNRWDMSFVAAPREALALVEAEPFDVIVSDMRMPDMNGVELLERVRGISPATVRIVLSGHAETSAIMKSVGPSHLFLSKPCAPETLERAIHRACALRSKIRDPELVKLVGSIETLPSLPAIYSELIEAIDQDADMAQIGAIISKDMAMTAKLLKLVNSSYFGLPQEVADPSRAAVLLGIEMVQALILGVKIFDQLESESPDRAKFERLWDHTTRVAAISRDICLLEGCDDVLKNQIGVAALLHDVGLLILLIHRGQMLEEVETKREQEQLSAVVAERQVLDCTHGDVGAQLSALWGFPDPILEAIAYHHDPSACVSREFMPLTVIHAAQALADCDVGAGDAWIECSALDATYLEEVGVTDRIPVWAAKARERRSSAADDPA